MLELQCMRTKWCFFLLGPNMLRLELLSSARRVMHDDVHAQDGLCLLSRLSLMDMYASPCSRYHNRLPLTTWLDSYP
jgi:hypothetical protein